jgi:ribonuclease HII
MLKPLYKSCIIEAGCDEAGRGCLAGPVFAAAVVLPVDFSHTLLDDSKKMTARNRDILRAVIEREAVAWAVEAVGPERIDEINILNASFEAMTGAVQQILERTETRPGLLLIDGNRFRTSLDIPFECIIGGDGLYASIAAASVLAKTHRDEFMERAAADHPEYGWLQNKGYPTKQHRKAILKYGLSPLHRRTFTFRTSDVDGF